MKKLTLIIFLSLLAAANQGMAQSYVFRVLAQKGNNTYMHENQELDLKTGSKLVSGDEIVLENDAYVGLLHKTGATMELKKDGKYKIDELNNQMSGTSKSLMNKYANYVISKAESDSKSENQRLNVTGAVHRGKNNLIKVFLPNSVELFENATIIDWNDIEGAEYYIVTYKNMYDETITTEETGSSFIKLDLTDPKFAKERLVIISVTDKNNTSITSDEFGIKKLAAPEFDKINTEYQKLSKELGKESAINNLVLASFFEDHSLLGDAITYYQKAMELSPDVKDYENYYLEFLNRNFPK